MVDDQVTAHGARPGPCAAWTELGHRFQKALAKDQRRRLSSDAVILSTPRSPNDQPIQRVIPGQHVQAAVLVKATMAIVFAPSRTSRTRPRAISPSSGNEGNTEARAWTVFGVHAYCRTMPYHNKTYLRPGAAHTLAKSDTKTTQVARQEQQGFYMSSPRRQKSPV